MLSVLLGLISIAIETDEMEVRSRQIMFKLQSLGNTLAIIDDSIKSSFYAKLWTR